MRIISGKFGGRVVKQKIPSNIRPTTDRLKERIFNILNNYVNWDLGPIVADIYAGTGAFGFETISKGARHCHFFENSKKAIDLINKTAIELQISAEFLTIYKGNALQELEKIKEKQIFFDICFLDPPYLKNLITKALFKLINFSLLSKNSIIIIEHSSLETIMLPKEYKIIDKRIDGGSIIQLLSI